MANNCIDEGQAKQLYKHNKELARREYLSLLDEVISSLIKCENLIYKEELIEDYTLEDLYSIVSEGLKEARAPRLKRYKPITLDKYNEMIKEAS